MIWDQLGEGFALLFTVEALLCLVIGLVAGFVVGILPGFGASSAAALVLPFTTTLQVHSALILIVGIYAGAQFGGSVPAVLMNIPGEASSAVTAIEGYPMSKRGKAQVAIGIARMSSVMGGLISTLVIAIAVSFLARFALSFGTRELFFVTILGLVAIGMFVRTGGAWKGFVSALLGLAIGAMSASPATSQPRFTMGQLGLYEGIPLVPAIVGVFGICQMFLLILERHKPSNEFVRPPRETWAEFLEGIRTTFAHPVTIFRSSLVGIIVGIIPGIGTAVGSFFSYSVAQRRSKTPEQFGKGAPEGLIAAETADTATAAATLVPTLTLGLPGSGVGAVMLGALYLQGIIPGPRVMETNGPEVYAIFSGLFIGSALILPLGLLLARPMLEVVRIPISVLVPIVLVLCAVGTYAVRSSLFDVLLAFIFGGVATWLRVRNFPIIPLIIALILGPMAESYFLRAAKLGGGDPLYFVSSPIAGTLFGAIVLLLGWQVFSSFRKRGKRNAAAVAASPAAEKEPAKVGEDA